MRKISLSLVVLAAASSLVLTGCSSDSNDSKEPKSKGATAEKDVLTSYNPQPASNLKQGGKLTLPHRGDPRPAEPAER